MEGRKHEFLVYIDYNNIQKFQNIKSLSSCQVC